MSALKATRDDHAAGRTRRASRHRLAAGAVVLAALALAVPVALASPQLPGGGGDVDVGGTVPSYLGLTVTQPNGLGSFPAASGLHSYKSSFAAAVTSTNPSAQLSVSDEGDYGHLNSGMKKLVLPLQVAAPRGPFLSLGNPGELLLERWTGPVSGRQTIIQLLQRIDGAPPVSGPYRTVLLVSASTGTP